MATLKDRSDTFPHIAVRTVEREEAYLPGTGLAVWEVAWIAGGYVGDIEATVQHLGIDCELVEEALAYAAEHDMETQIQIHDHVSWTDEEVMRLMPRARAIAIEVEPSEPSPS
jgi:hypothetical protein